MDKTNSVTFHHYVYHSLVGCARSQRVSRKLRSPEIKQKDLYNVLVARNFLGQQLERSKVFIFSGAHRCRVDQTVKRWEVQNFKARNLIPRELRPKKLKKKKKKKDLTRRAKSKSRMQIFETLRESDNIRCVLREIGENERQISVYFFLETIAYALEENFKFSPMPFRFIIAYALEKTSNVSPCRFICLSLSVAQCLCLYYLLWFGVAASNKQ